MPSMHWSTLISSAIHFQHAQVKYHGLKTLMNSIGENFVGNERRCRLLLQEDPLVSAQAEDGQTPELGQARKTETAVFLAPLHVLGNRIHLGVMVAFFGVRLITGVTRRTRCEQDKVTKAHINHSLCRKGKAACHLNHLYLHLPIKRGAAINLTGQRGIEHALVVGRMETLTLISQVIVEWVNASEGGVAIVQALPPNTVILNWNSRTKQPGEIITGTTFQGNEAEARSWKTGAGTQIENCIVDNNAYNDTIIQIFGCRRLPMSTHLSYNSQETKPV